MRTPFTSISTGCLTLVALSTLCLAQGVAPPLPPVTPPLPHIPVYDVQQFPAVHGELERLTLTAGGEIDGFILTDGTEVKIAPDLTTQIAAAIKPGDRVTVYGLKAAALPLVSAVSVTDESTHRTVTDAGASGVPPMNAPPPPPAPVTRSVAPRQPLGATRETGGRVRMALHGPQGEVNGLLLEGGAILRFPPDQGAQLTTLIQPSQTVVAEGIAITNALGTVVDVQRIGPSRDRLVAVGPAEGAPQLQSPPLRAAPGPGVPPPPAQTDL